MRTSNFFLTGLATATLFAASCKKDDHNNSRLQPIEFPTVQDRDISRMPTSETAFNPVTSSFAPLYDVTREGQMRTSTPCILSPTASAEIIYPGSILRGSSFMKAAYDPLVLSNPFDDVTLSLSLKGRDGLFSTLAKPVLSHIRAGLNSLLTQNENKIDTRYVPADYIYSSDSITNEESFLKNFSTHVDASIAKAIVKADFKYERSTSSANKQTYILVKMVQNVYSASIDPKYVTDWISGTIKSEECGTHEPVYISNVNYGRTAYFLLQTNMSASEASTMINASVGVALGVFSGSASVNYNKQFKSLFESNKIAVKIVGGSAAAVTKVTNYTEFVSFIKNTTAEELVKSSAPISYTVRRLFDNTKVEVALPYREINRVF